MPNVRAFDEVDDVLRKIFRVISASLQRASHPQHRQGLLDRVRIRLHDLTDLAIVRKGTEDDHIRDISATPKDRKSGRLDVSCILFDLFLGR